MVTISLAQLQERLGRDLQSDGGGRPERLDLTGVHISELTDPTPYLGGGELLLTTGIPLAGTDEHVSRYVRRLVDHGVAALGLGLGAGTDHVPPHLADACRAEGLALLIVPDGTPFLQVSRAYWDLVGRTEHADFAANLGLQTSLARAATQPGAAASVVRVLAEALGGWAAYLPADGTPESLWPANESRVLPKLREETARLNLAGTHAAATFPLLGTDVVEYSIVAGGRTAGFLAVGAGRALRPSDRQLMLTGCMLLSITAQQGWEVRRANAILGGTAATLLLHGHIDASRLVAAELGLPPLTERVRVLAVTGEQADLLSTEELADAIASMAGREDASELRKSIRHSSLRCTFDGLDYVIVDVPKTAHDAAGAAAAPAGAPHSAQAVTVPGRLPPAALGLLKAAISGPVTLAQLSSIVVEVGRACRRAASGTLVPVENVLDPRAELWVEELRVYTRADLVETVRCYLRHRGQWETTARDLQVHRNSLRHRIEIASRLIDADLDDPDVAANLWLALRGVTTRPVQPA
ncbi:PucR family transcriptional regulator [Cryobacterium zhongshanensis]|uniref:PucR family transcriptional regulator n=1 Tax=Cryobacterium zhongshanensis TaxID=2928153 RepID=A0AA41QT52_9MICO|nr:PucR family transcriptional regulator [Cryobacterium zhongshanensis]MCI4657212.1 PucR family transcriptional regulator [Cryobacterium zhongshanensis]